MSAVLGIVHSNSRAVEGRWQGAVDRMASRCGASATAVRTGANLSVAFRGRDPSGFAENESWTVMLDGFLDDLPAEDAHNPAGSLLTVLEEHGVGTLYRRTGCYAVVAIDWRTGTVHLQRDRLGTRPLYYAQMEGGWCWASEIKCLTPLLAALEFDRDALPELFYYRWLAGPRSLLRGVRQLLPGHAVTLQAGRPAAPHCYWKYKFESPSEGDFDELVDRAGDSLSKYLRALARRFPRVGIPLSAGVDSPLLAALASRAGFRDCITISVRYPDWENPELVPALATAKHLKLEHQTVDVEPAFVAAQARPLLWRLEEPARHYHIFPLYRMLETLAPRVDLVLYGEGADRMFGPVAVRSLELFLNRQRVLRPIPAPLRRLAARLAERWSTGRSRYFRYLAELLIRSPNAYICRICSIKSRTGPEILVPGVDPEVTPSPESLETFFPPDLALPERMQILFLYTETKCHLDTMDRLSAPTGAQVAVPFLSAPLLDLACEIPPALKNRDGFSKPILRELGARYFPREWMYRPKYGFDTPTESWLRGPLLPFLEILREPRTLDRGLFQRQAIDQFDLQGDWELLWTAACLETLLRFLVDGEDAA